MKKILSTNPETEKLSPDEMSLVLSVASILSKAQVAFPTAKVASTILKMKNGQEIEIFLADVPLAMEGPQA